MKYFETSSCRPTYMFSTSLASMVGDWYKNDSDQAAKGGYVR